MKRLALLLIALGVAAVYALFSFFNVTYWRVNATLPPVMKDFNASLYPLARGWYQLSDVNITYYYMKFMPGWPEQYVVGRFRARDPGWSARLVAVSRAGNPGGTYAISLGGQPQITDQQDAGPFVPTTAQLVWTTTTTGRYSVLARAIFQQGGITAWQWVNFTAEPMQRLYQQSFSCPGYTYQKTFTCSGSTTYYDPLAYTSKPAYITEYTVYSTTTLTNPVQYTGTSIRTQIDARSTGYGISSIIYNVRSRWGSISAGGTVVSVEGTYYRNSQDTQNNVAYVSIGIDTNGDGTADIEIIAYVWDTTAGYNGAIYSVLVNPGTQVASIGANGNPTTNPPQVYGLIMVQSVSNGYAFKITVVLPSTLSGNIVSVALAVVDAWGYIAGSPAGDFWVDWKNLSIQTPCSAPSDLQTVTRGQQYTSVFVAPGNYLVTQVDAYGNNNNPSADYGIAAGIFSYVFNATNAAISVTAQYYRGVGDGTNNVVYIDLLVDSNFDGVGDVEYIYYYYDTAQYNGVIVSPFTSQVVCTVSSAGTCNAPAGYLVTALGAITSYKQTLSFNINLGSITGAVLKIALVVTDASYYDSGNINSDIQVLWGPVSITSYSCPLPGGWYSTGVYAWQTNYALFLANGAVAYRGLVPNALTYLSNFTGVGAFVVFDSSFNVIFGVFKTGSSFSALCGPSAVALGTLPAAKYVELRPLNGFGDVIIRDQNGAILARYGCTYSTTPQYVGYKTNAGQILKAYSIEAWG